MYYQLTGALKRRLILELRRYWASHPRFPDLVDNIQGKYSFKERPQHGIIVKTGSASKVNLSADNFQGTVWAHCTLTLIDNYAGTAIEWVREDPFAIKKAGKFPSKAGVYYIELTKDNEFYVDPLLDVYRERLEQLSDTQFQLANTPLDGTLRIYEMPSNLVLYDTTNYTFDPATQILTLVNPLPDGLSITADYRHPIESRGPFKIKPNFANRTAIEGCVLAFGRRCTKGDRMAIMISPFREPVALEYGGRWELSIDFDIIARDVFAQQEISDSTVMYLWAIARSYLVNEGINVVDVSLGGESEETYDQTGDDYYYTSNFSMSVETDWAVYVPLTAQIRRVLPETLEVSEKAAGMTDDQLATETLETRLKVVEELGLRELSDPYFKGKGVNFETIK
mgnify:CR=1 FL=1